ncbi:MAG: hypothetical protein U1E28_21930 [Beijerinckiaceae bacterium]
MISVLPTRVGLAAVAGEIVAQTTSDGLLSVKRVTLTQDYSQVSAVGYPTRPGPWPSTPASYLAGATITVRADEAAALVAAGAATYAGG